jgi:hypothetical protein
MRQLIQTSGASELPIPHFDIRILQNALQLFAMSWAIFIRKLSGLGSQQFTFDGDIIAHHFSAIPLSFTWSIQPAPEPLLGSRRQQRAIAHSQLSKQNGGLLKEKSYQSNCNFLFGESLPDEA